MMFATGMPLSLTIGTRHVQNSLPVTATTNTAATATLFQITAWSSSVCFTARAISSAHRPPSTPAAGTLTVTPATLAVFWVCATDWLLLRAVLIGAVQWLIDYIFQRQMAAGRSVMLFMRQISSLRLLT